MKIKTTKKEINRTNRYIYKIGYCDAQHLLHYRDPFAYSGGASGWNCDYYEIGGVVISTGYQPHGARVDYAILKEYESKARAAFDTVTNSDARRDLIDGYLNEFINKITEESNK